MPLEPFILPSGGIQTISRFFPPIPGEPSDARVATSYLGTPIYSNLIFNGTDEILEMTFNTVLMQVNQEKNVIRTPIQGRKGTVKEYISDGDYQVVINGLIVSRYPNVFPKQEVEQFVKFMELQQSLEVSSDFLQMFSIHNIVILGHTVEQQMGYQNQVPFSILAISDDPIEVKEL